MVLAPEAPTNLPQTAEICVLAKLTGVALCKCPAGEVSPFLKFIFALLRFLFCFSQWKEE